MVFNITFNNVSVVSGPSPLVMEETGVPGENHWQILSHINSKLVTSNYVDLNIVQG